MNEDSLKHGAFGWNELMTTDVEGAAGFYASLFGWEVEKAPIPGMDYTMVKVDGDPVGGIMTMPDGCEGMPPCWGVYVTVEDVDVIADKAVSLGGKVVHAPTDIPNVGRFCVIQDPQGATIGAMAYVRE